jgi:hypothetical protein
MAYRDRGVNEQLAASPVEREEIAVMFIRTPDDPEQFGPAFGRLEELVGTRGRKFYGAFYPGKNEYRACVVTKDGDDAARLGVEAGTLPGGRYLRTRLHGEPPELYARIAPTFEQLLALATADDSRPSLEFYRRHDEVDLLLPVTDA